MATPVFPKTGEFASDKRVQLVEETGCFIFTDPNDGMEYEFDSTKGAWFPMWNDVLMEQQQSAYGAEKNEECVGYATEASEKHIGTKRKANDMRKSRENTSIYISGLPSDTTEAEVVEYFSQCGTIMPDIITNKPRVKLYCHKDGRIKGDALVTYFKSPSVKLAVDILDDSQFRATSQLRISVQEFDANKDDKGPEASAPKKSRVDTKLVQKRLGQLERKLDWSEEEKQTADRYKRTVILEHMFTLAELEEDITLLLDLPEDVRSECEKIGSVSSVKVYDLSEEGAISVKFRDELSAQACVKAMNGRFFGGRQIKAAIYNGHKRYRFSGKDAGLTNSTNEPDLGERPKGKGKSDSRDNTDGNSDGDDNNCDGKDADKDHQRMERYAQWLESEN
ncbi:hypothetical protein BX661DRAFT_141308 [Kickxella alabastrina]|uniref:uncharacterized protein n=1 Tax=Kickxella alabastrina TaxID=61397 RepID=UPI00221E8CCE|nr:uncharacterized protein BX661DRAFT_141308 [Kickxella alabastrina]KAI7833074.1 hypothetical protein BX661DRAFT_141308 [Kickxella alabastrina]